jgi:hypothetical protein
VTCLVGKNESGKTALLQALYRLNPIVERETKCDVTEDYPRLEVENYLRDVEAKTRREHYEAITAVFALEDREVAAVNADFGDGVLTSRDVELSRGYEAKNGLYVTVRVSEAVAIKTLVKKAGLPDDVAAEASKQTSLKALETYLAADAETRQQQFTKMQKTAQARLAELPQVELPEVSVLRRVL